MKKQRYLYTAALAVLIWLLIIAYLQKPLMIIMQLDLQIATVLTVSMFLSTIAGIWVVDAACEWSDGRTSWSGLMGLFSRAGIAVVATVLFAFCFARTLWIFTDVEFTFREGVSHQGILALSSVWIAATIVDLLIRKYNRQ